MTNSKVEALVTTGLVACGSSKGTDPHDTSAAQREQTAGAEEAAARQHGHQLDPSAGKKFLYCDDAVPCWTSTENPTEPRKAEMARRRELTAKHRAASRVLRDAETKACVGVPDDGRVMGPFRLEDVNALVVGAGDGSAIEIASNDRAVAREIVRRAAAAAGPGAPSTEGRS